MCLGLLAGDNVSDYFPSYAQDPCLISQVTASALLLPHRSTFLGLFPRVIYLLHFFHLLCVHVCAHMCHGMHVEVEGNLSESVLSFHHVCPEV